MTRPAQGTAAAGERAGTVRVAVEGLAARDAPAASGTLELPRHTGRFERTLDLATVEGLSRLRLELALPPGRELVVWDAVIHGRRTLPDRVPASPQVLLISLDTFRADAIAALGGRWNTPNLDRLVARSEAFAPHYAASGWTKPSHASLLTGFSPPVHGAEGEGGVLAAGVPTLAERFRRAGSLTAALISECTWLDPRFGFARGFDDYRSERWSVEQASREVAHWLIDQRDPAVLLLLSQLRGPLRLLSPAVRGERHDAEERGGEARG